MRLLIILTEPSYKLLQDPDGWEHDAACESWSMKVGDDRICVVSQCCAPDYAEDEEDRRNQIRATSTRRLAAIIKQLPTQQSFVYLAFHKGYVDPLALKADSGCDTAAAASFIHEREYSNENVYPKLWSLVQSPTADNFKDAIEAVTKKQGEHRAERVAALSYQVMRHFTPIQLDLSSWDAMNLDDERRAQITTAYAKAAERVVKVRRLLYGSDASPDENLEKIIIESRLTQHAAWITIQSLLPRERPNDSVTTLFDEAFQLYARVALLADDQQASEFNRMIGPGNVLKKWCDAVDAALNQLAREVAAPLPKFAVHEAVSAIRQENTTDPRISHH